MSLNHLSPAGEYLKNTRQVLGAGRQLLEALEQDDLEALDYAVKQLASASDAQGSSADNYRAFMFSEGEAAEQRPRSAGVPKALALEDVFASTLTDLQVGNVLLAAGQSVEEEGAQPRPELLADALGRLENTAASIGGGPGGVSPARFNFSESEGQPAPSKSSTDDEAVGSYRERAGETLDALVKETYGVAASVIEALKQLDPSAVLKALEGLGGPIKAAVGFADRLITKGVEKIKSAVEALVNFIGNDALTKIKDKLLELWREVSEGDFAQSLLAHLLGIHATHEKVAQRLDAGNIDRDSLAEGSDALARLVADYRKHMGVAKKSVAAITFASAVIGWTSLGPQNAALIAGVGYSTVLAAVMLVGMDYADSGRVLRIVRGVGEVTDGLRPRTNAPAD